MSSRGEGRELVEMHCAPRLLVLQNDLTPVSWPSTSIFCRRCSLVLRSCAPRLCFTAVFCLVVSVLVCAPACSCA